MESFDYARAFGQILMTFAIFVIVSSVLSRFRWASRRPWLGYAIAFIACSLLIVFSSAPLDVVSATLAIFSLLAFWRFRAATKK